MAPVSGDQKEGIKESSRQGNLRNECPRTDSRKPISTPGGNKKRGKRGAKRQFTRREKLSPASEKKMTSLVKQPDQGGEGTLAGTSN